MAFRCLPAGQQRRLAATAYEGFDTVCYSQLGTAVAAQSFPLATLTDGLSDVLSVPAQHITVNLLPERLPVLLVQRRFVQQNSFYLSGQPAPAFLLTASSQTQGAKTQLSTQQKRPPDGWPLLLG